MPQENIASEVFAASLGGAISASILYPLEVLKTKMQAEGSSCQKEKENENENTSCTPNSVLPGLSSSSPPPKSLSMIEYAERMYTTDGPRIFLNGIEGSALQSATEKALYFFAYTILKNGYYKLTTTRTGNHHKRTNDHRNHDDSMGTLTNLAFGYMADWAHLPITLPLDCWTTAVQMEPITSNRNGMQILTAMLSSKGIKGMYKGIQAYKVLCLKPALQYTVFEQLKKMRLRSKHGKSLAAAEAFLIGMFARAVATVVVFPYLRAKVLIQVSNDDDTNGTSTSKKEDIPAMLRLMYQKGGMSELFRGIGPELTRGVFSAALMLMIKEQLATVVQNAL